MTSHRRPPSGWKVLLLVVARISQSAIVESFTIQTTTFPLIHRHHGGIPQNAATCHWHLYHPQRLLSTTTTINNARSFRRQSSSSLSVVSLTSALESLADERSQNVTEYRYLNWLDPRETTNVDGNKHNNKKTQPSSDQSSSESVNDVRTMPLYPLSAVYLPTGRHSKFNHTLINTEPRNLQMARDLRALSMKIGPENEDPLFCVTLAALDTGRLAKVGTVMKMIAMDDQTNRIVVTCVAQEAVDIVQIVNPEAASWDSRIRRSSEYLVAKVQSRPPKTEGTEMDNDKSSGAATMADELLEDYLAVRAFYTQQQNDDISGASSKDLPPFAIPLKMEENLPLFTATDLGTSQGLYKFASIWQALCYTVREGRQILLSSDRNELLVEAAVRKGGPLQLPVHVEDVSPADRKAVDDLQIQAQQDWLALHLDPCLDFQVLLELNTDVQRLEFLARLVSRERSRLARLVEQRQKYQRDVMDEIELRNNNQRQEQPKGAWFNDELWQ